MNEEHFLYTEYMNFRTDMLKCGMEGKKEETIVRDVKNAVKKARKEFSEKGSLLSFLSLCFTLSKGGKKINQSGRCSVSRFCNESARQVLNR